MNFFNVGPLELAVILILAILLVGPKRVVEIVQAIRRLAGQLRTMSGEFTSLIQTEMGSAEREIGQEPADADEDQPALAVGSPDESQDSKRETGETLAEVIREGIAPIASIQAELRATAQETRQTLESIVKDELGPIAGITGELETTAKETRQALESPVQDEPGSTPSIQAELEAAARDTQQALEGLVTDVTDIAKDERGAKKGQHEEPN